MLPLEHPDRIQVSFDNHRMVANAGLLLPVTLAQHLGLREFVDSHVDLGDAPGRANTGDKIVTLVASALAGGDCIDDADALRTGRTARVLGCVVKAPSTLGTFLRSFRWGHVRQLDRVGRELLAKAWAAGAGPGDAPLTIDLDSTICKTYGLVKEGARHHSYTGQRAAHHARRPRLLHPRRGVRLPRDECPLFHHHPPARPPAQSHRGHTRRCLDADTLLDGRRRRCGRDHLHSLSQKSDVLKAIDLLTPTYAGKMINSDAFPTYACR